LRVGFAGLSLMDGKGEENNEVVFLKRLTNEFVSKNIDVTFFHEESIRGINDVHLFNYMEIKADRFNLGKYTRFPNCEYESYTESEIAYGLNGHIPQDKSYRDQRNIRIKYRHKIIVALENLREYINANPVDVFIVFGNYLISNIIKIFCRKNNIRYYVLENGYFRPFTLMIDNYGVNYESSIPRNMDFYKDIEVIEEELELYLDKPKYAIEDKEYSFHEREKYYQYYNIKISKPEDSKTFEKENNSVVNEDTSLAFIDASFLNDGYIYIPFQLETDSQITKHSPYIKTMKDVVLLTSEALLKYNEKNQTNLKIIYKCHPLYESELGRIDIDGIEEICSQSENLFLLKKGDNKILMDNAKIVITINSTVGFESLQRYKSVITLGDAFYAIEGISNSWTPEKKLEDIIENVIVQGPSVENIKKFVYYLRFKYFFEIYWKNPDQQSIERLANKIIQASNIKLDNVQLV
jgi:capsular polysaccharide export protein